VRVRDSLDQYSFSHELLRDALYRNLPEAANRHEHLRIGETLETLLARGKDVSWAELAYHFRSALPDANPRTVLDDCVRASRAASGVFAHADSALRSPAGCGSNAGAASRISSSAASASSPSRPAGLK
jgi:hypothetical protein